MKISLKLRITEREMKADIVTTLTDEKTIGVPRVNLWHRVLAAVAEVKPAEMRLAFDADKNETKPSYRDPETDEPVVVGRRWRAFISR